MILGVYRRNTGKAPWLLVCTANTAEVAKQDKALALARAQKEGKVEAEVAVVPFETAWLIPESLKSIEEDDRLLYN